MAQLQRLALIICSLTLAGPSVAGTPESDYFQEEVTKAKPSKSFKGDKKGKLGAARMRKANEAAAAISKARMRKTRANDLQLLSQAAEADIVVTAGAHDRVQDVLAAMEMKHVVIPRRLLSELDLMATQTLMINCDGAMLNKAAVAKVRSFVGRGGYLVTTDWALKNVTQVFPGTIAKGKKHTRDDVVRIDVHDHNEPLLAHVKLLKDKPRWWLEGESYPIRILNKRKVKVLMSSKEMKKKYGYSPIAVSFRHDDGKVLHMTSHFYLQRSKLVARSEKQKGSAFAKKAGLTDGEIADLKNKGIDADEVAAGDINSAYSMQQFSTNLLVTKQKANKKLLKRYGKKMRRQVGKGKKGTMRKDFRVKVLKKKGKQVYVEDLFGNRAWVSSEDLQ